MILEAVQTQRAFKPFKLLLYGENGIGKTTFCSQMPQPLIVDFDQNADHLDVPRLTVSSYGYFQSLLKDLKEQQHAYRTIVLDSVDMLQEVIWEQICGENNLSSIEDLSYGRGYVMAQSIWKTILDDLDALRLRGLSVVLVGHPTSSQNRTVDGEEYERISFQLHRKAADLICNWCHSILFASYAVFIRTEQGAFGRSINRAIDRGDRILYTNGHGAFRAKNVYNLPDHIPFTWEAFSSHVKHYFQSTKSTATETTTTAKETTK